MRKGYWTIVGFLVSLVSMSLFAGGGAEKPLKETGKGGRVKITYSNWGSVDEIKVLQETINKFNASQNKIEVEAIPIPWETYMTKLNTMAAAKQLPDTGIMSEAGVLQWAEQGMLLDISDMYASSESKPLDSLAFKYKGKIVAYSAANEILLLFYNKKMFEAAKIPYPPKSADKAWTWDQFLDVARKLTLDKNGKHPDDPGFDPKQIVQYGCLVENLPWQLETWTLSNGGGYYSEDGSQVIIDRPESIEAIQMIADLHLKHHVAPLSVGMTDDSIQRSIIAGTVAMATGGQWNIGTCLAKAKQEGLDYGVAVLPYMKKKVTLCTGGPNVVFSQTKYPQEAKEWIKWYAKEENSWNLISSGIWMPVLEKWYTDESLTKKWVMNPNFPPYEEYKSAVVDYARDMKIVRPAAWYYVNNTVDFNNVLQSILGDVWVGKKTAKEAIISNIDKLKAAFRGEKR